MANKVQNRCLNCGKVFEIEILAEKLFMRSLFSVPPQASSFCPLCVAKINKESEETQKQIKPV